MSAFLCEVFIIVSVFAFLYLCLMDFQDIWSRYRFIHAPKNYMKMRTGIQSVHRMNSFDCKIMNCAARETMRLIHVAIGLIAMKLA